MSNSPIVSVNQGFGQSYYFNYILDDIIKTNPEVVGIRARDTKIVVDVPLLSKLPQSLLSTMFPNGAKGIPDLDYFDTDSEDAIYIRAFPESFDTKYSGIFLAVPLEPDYLLYVLNYYKDLQAQIDDINQEFLNGKPCEDVKNVATDPNQRTSVESADSEVIYFVTNTNLQPGGSTDIKQENAELDPSKPGDASKELPGTLDQQKNTVLHHQNSQTPIEIDFTQSVDTSHINSNSENENGPGKPSKSSSKLLDIELDTGVDLNKALATVDLIDIGDLEDEGESNEEDEDIQKENYQNRYNRNSYDSSNYGLIDDFSGLTSTNYLSKATAVIILKEELDYFVVPKSSRTVGDIGGVSGYDLDMAKTDCGKFLLEDKAIFNSILAYIGKLESSLQDAPDSNYNQAQQSDQGNVSDATTKPGGTEDANQALNETHSQKASDGNLDNQESPFSQIVHDFDDNEEDHSVSYSLTTLGSIEKQLVEMLCSFEFNHGSKWACRTITPDRASICSISLVLMDKCKIQQDSKAAKQMFGFYRKPAIKCWWDSSDISLAKDNKLDVQLFCRRTWTLELSLQ